MNEYGTMTPENATLLPSREKKKSRSHHKNLAALKDSSSQNDDACQEETRFERQTSEINDELRDFDSDSGVSSLRHSRAKLASSISGTNIIFDNESEYDAQHAARASSHTDRRGSDVTSFTDITATYTSSDYFPDSRKTSQTSNSPPRLSTETPSTSTTNVKSSINPMPVASSSVDNKSKNPVRSFIRKFLRGSSNGPKSNNNLQSQSTDATPSPKLNIDHVRGTAYPPMSPLPITQGPIRLLVLRHGERLDRYYSSQWLRQAFDKDANYCRFSPILPETLPIRAAIRDFDLDPPLTYKGLKDAFHTGTVLRDKNITINYCYSSPALRCVQTAAKILEGLQLHNRIRIRLEPGLFECTGWYTTEGPKPTLTMPRFLTKKEFLENKYSIEKNYREQMTYNEISQTETELEFYQRSHAVTASILNMHENEMISQIQQGQITAQQNLHILFIAHAPSLETCTRKLCGGKFRPETLAHVIRNVDFLTMTVIEKTDNTCDKWIFRRSSFYGDEF